jgi:hypothetical protein
VFGGMFSILHFFMFSFPSREHSLEFRLPQLREYMHGQVHGLRHGHEQLGNGVFSRAVAHVLVGESDPLRQDMH